MKTWKILFLEMLEVGLDGVSILVRPMLMSLYFKDCTCDAFFPLVPDPDIDPSRHPFSVPAKTPDDARLRHLIDRRGVLGRPSWSNACGNILPELLATYSSYIRLTPCRARWRWGRFIPGTRARRFIRSLFVSGRRKLKIRLSQTGITITDTLIIFAFPNELLSC